MKTGGLHDGLKTKSPKDIGGSDLPMKMAKSSTVNDDTTRKGVAPTPRTLGPRDA